MYKPIRGTSMYYQESKKNLFALLRQFECPTLFLTVSMAEFQWGHLLKEVLETVYKTKFSEEEIAGLEQAEKNRIISENVEQTTLHFQKK